MGIRSGARAVPGLAAAACVLAAAWALWSEGGAGPGGGPAPAGDVPAGEAPGGAVPGGGDRAPPLPEEAHPGPGDLPGLPGLPGGRAGGAGSGGFRGNPHMGRDPESLAPRREEARAKVEALLRAWREAAPGEAKGEAMRRLAVPAFQYLEAGGSMDLLADLEEAAERGETPLERRSAVIAVHTLWQAPAVDFLLARARSLHPEVRYYAFEGLAWVRGAEEERALGAVEAGLEDPDPRVRGIAATSLGLVVADPGRVRALLDRLRREDDAGAVRAMAAAILALDPVGGPGIVHGAAPCGSGDGWAGAEGARREEAWR